MKTLRHFITVVAALCALTGAVAKPTADVVNRVPVTNVPLGDFPYFTWPTEDQPQNTPVTRADGHFLFWTGLSLRNVAGKTYLVTVLSANDRVEFNQYATKRSFETAFAKAGATKIASARLSQHVLESISSADRQDLGAGLGDIFNDPVETWLIRRPDRQIWIGFTSNSAQASLAVVETPRASATTSALAVRKLFAPLYAGYSNGAGVIWPECGIPSSHASGKHGVDELAGCTVSVTAERDVARPFS